MTPPFSFRAVRGNRECAGTTFREFVDGSSSTLAEIDHAEVNENYEGVVLDMMQIFHCNARMHQH